MKYEDEIFISYAHIDNEPLAEGQRGWVQLLDERLRKRLAEVPRYDPRNPVGISAWCERNDDPDWSLWPFLRLRRLGERCDRDEG